MKLTTKSEYALLALIYLSRNYNKGYIPLSKIAKVQNIPLKYLEHLVVVLCRAGYLTSVKGQHGGYCLAKKSDRINLAEIIRLFDGALAPSHSVSKYYYKSSPIEKEKKVVRLLKEIRDYIVKKLNRITLADIS